VIRKAFVVLVALLGACTTGPDVSYIGPAFTLNARFANLPAGEISSVEVVINLVQYSAHEAPQQPEVGEVPVDWRSSVLVGDSAQIEFTAAYTPPQQIGTSFSDRDLRFFRLTSVLQMQPGDSFSSIGPWDPHGYYLVYTQIPTTFSPFGPSGPTIDFPKGYSWLQRSCGTSTGAIDMAVVSTDEVVDFYEVETPPTLRTDQWTIELSERALVQGCGAAVPAADLGSHVSFDRAQSLVWSADGASISYLAPADPLDPTQSVSLRQLRLADAATSEIVAIPIGHGLQIDSAGRLYVGNDDNLLQVDTSVTPAALVVIPVPSEAVVSPDGRWLAYYPSTTGDNGLHVWDIQSGADLIAVSQMFLGWSPDSTLAYWSPYTAPSTFSILSPADPGQPKTYGTMGNSDPSVVWNTGGPLFARRPVAWSVQSGTFPACDACFGLSIQDPSTGDELPILDASAGMIDIVPTRPVLGFMLVWARTCLGLYNTVCSYSLIRVDLTDGSTRVTAVSPTEVPVAVSPDYQRVALAAPGGIYVKSLAP
jgi:hypothetical protein